MKELFDYFKENWQREPHPVIDHSLRIQMVELDNGKYGFHFYIHPSNTGGTTTDFIVSETEFKKREF